MNIEQSPITQMEQRIAGYWGELLGLQEIGRGDHFIALGGNSLLATMLANRIEEDMGIRPSMGELFNTLGEVATSCEQLVREQSEAGR